MAKRGVIVRRLTSIENFGSMDILCTDKTGTLTEGVVSLDGAHDAQGQVSEAILRYAYLNAHFQTGLTNRWMMRFRLLLRRPSLTSAPRKKWMKSPTIFPQTIECNHCQ